MRTIGDDTGTPEQESVADASMLRQVIGHLEAQNLDEPSMELEAFQDMLSRMKKNGRALSEKQRAWLRRTAERYGVTDERELNLVSRGLVPRGRDVPTPPALRNLPKKPPGR